MFSSFVSLEIYGGQLFCLLSTRLLLLSRGFVRFLEFLKVVSFYKKKVKWMWWGSTVSRSVKGIDIDNHRSMFRTLEAATYSFQNFSRSSKHTRSGRFLDCVP